MREKRGRGRERKRERERIFGIVGRCYQRLIYLGKRTLFWQETALTVIFI